MSLFGSDSESELETTPKGLHHFPSLISPSIQSTLSLALSTESFFANTNQSMLFSSPTHPFPQFLESLLELLPQVLLAKIRPPLHAQLFDNPAQTNIIMNLYRPGEGISPHVDLPNRYQNGIIGLSLLSTTTMDFTRGSDTISIILRPGDVYILEGEARYDWVHGIASRDRDVVMENGVERTIMRGTRMSITVRRMVEGADCVGEEELTKRDG